MESTVGVQRKWRRAITVLGLLATILSINAADGPPQFASVDVQWRFNGSPLLPGSAVGTTQWVDVIVDLGDSGLSAYQLELSIANAIVLPGSFSETPPAPLISDAPPGLVNGNLIENISAQAPTDESLAGPARVTVFSFQVNVAASGNIVETGNISLTDETGADVIALGSFADVEPVDLNKLTYTYELVATTEGGAHTSFIEGGALANNGQLAFLDSPLTLDENSSQILYSYENGTLKMIAENTGKFLKLWAPRINDAGSVIFFANDGGLEPGGTGYEQGLYEYQNNSLNEFMSADTVIPLPDTPAPPGFNAFGVGNYINDHRQVVFGANYWDVHEEPDGDELLGFHTIWWKDLTVPNSDPIELYRGITAEGFVNRPAIYDDVSVPMGFNNAGQILFTMTLDGVERLVIGGIENRQPVTPVVVASTVPGEFIEWGANAKLNEDGSVVFTATPAGESFDSLYHWKNGTLQPVIRDQNAYDIQYQPSLGFAATDDRVVFAGRNGDFQSALYQWTPDKGIETIFELGPGLDPGDVGDELLDKNGVPIRPRSDLDFYSTYLMGVDHLGRIALNIEWPDGVETLLHATPVYVPPKEFDLGQTSLGLNGFQLSFEGEPGQSLQLQATTDFSIWTKIIDFTSEEQPSELTDPNANALDLRFYRIVEQ